MVRSASGLLAIHVVFRARDRARDRPRFGPQPAAGIRKTYLGPDRMRTSAA
jgi:hypothetical protein